MGRGLLGELPVPGPEPDPRETPQRTRALSLVPLARPDVLALEQGPGLAPSRRRRQRVHERLGPLLDEPVRAEGGRQLLHELGEVAGRLALSVKPREDGLYRAGAGAELVVVELVGERERLLRVGVAGPAPVDPREPAVDRCLELRTRGRFVEGLFEQPYAGILGLELGEQDERLRPPRALVRLREEIRRDRARAGPLAGRAAGAGRGERPAASLIGRVRRR